MTERTTSLQKHIKVLYGLMIVGFLSLSVQIWLQTKDINEFESLFKQTTDMDNTSVLVSKVEAKGPEKFTMDLGLIENKIDFKRHINSLKEN